MKDVQITFEQFKELSKNYEAILVGIREEFETEGSWIRFINDTINKIKSIEENLRKNNITVDIIVAEVLPRIKSTWSVKWKESRSGSRRPRGIRKTISIVEEKKSELYILVDKSVSEEVKKYLGVYHGN